MGREAQAPPSITIYPTLAMSLVLWLRLNVPILKMGQLRPRDIKQPARGHTAEERDSKPAQKAIAFPTCLCFYHSIFRDTNFLSYVDLDRCNVVTRSIV